MEYLTFDDDNMDVEVGFEKRELLVPVHRKNRSFGTVSCRYRMEGRTAVAGRDFQADTGELVFPPGVTECVIPVTVLPKKLGEHSDKFQILIEEPQGGAIFNPNMDG